LELKQAKNPNPGLELSAFDLEYFFAKKIGGQAAGLKQALQDFPADVILTDSMFFGTLPMLLGAREERPAIVHLGISLLNLFSAKNSPPQPGMSEKEQLAERERRERVFHKPAKAGVDKALAELGCGPLPCSPLESMSVLPDLYLQPGIESFQYSDDSSSSSHVHYIGLLPMPPGQPALPTWWHELDRTKRLVLVTQGTIANRNFGQLIGPTLTGLAKEEDVIVLVSTGGQPIESILTEIPANAHVCVVSALRIDYAECRSAGHERRIWHGKSGARAWDSDSLGRDDGGQGGGIGACAVGWCRNRPENQSGNGRGLTCSGERSSRQPCV
jgi:hypothetical protein